MITLRGRLSRILTTFSALANEAMDTRRSWTTVEEDSIRCNESSRPDNVPAQDACTSAARHHDDLRYV